jgi:hypothetical protein
MSHQAGYATARQMDPNGAQRIRNFSSSLPKQRAIDRYFEPKATGILGVLRTMGELGRDLTAKVLLHKRIDVRFPSAVQPPPNRARLVHNEEDVQVGLGKLLAARHGPEQNDTHELPSERLPTPLH